MTPTITAKRRQYLAAKHGANEQYLSQCFTGRREMDPAEAMRLEVDSKGELTRQMLCPKTYPSIWPDLPAPKSAAKAKAA